MTYMSKRKLREKIETLKKQKQVQMDFKEDYRDRFLNQQRKTTKLATASNEVIDSIIDVLGLREQYPDTATEYTYRGIVRYEYGSGYRYPHPVYGDATATAYTYGRDQFREDIAKVAAAGKAKKARKRLGL